MSGLAMSMVGSGIQAYSSIEQGLEKRRAYEIQAEGKRAQSAQVELSAARELELTLQRRIETQGSQISAFGRGGVTISGSPLMMLERTAGKAYSEMLAIRQAADFRQKTLDVEGTEDLRAAGNAETAGYMGAFGSVLTNVGNNPYLYDQRMPNTGSTRGGNF